MGDSSSFTSLLELVDSHLSKYNVQELRSDNVEGTSSISIPIPSLNGVQRVLSDTCIKSPGEKLSLPKYCVSDSPIQNVLAEQISNMLKAKERKQQEEKQRLEEEMKKLSLQKEKDDEYVIDLLSAIQTPVPMKEPAESVMSRSNSFESLLLQNIKQFDEMTESYKTEESIEDEVIAPVPSLTDFSYIFTQKMNQAKCSAFGKVLTARLKPVAAPYLKVKIEPHKVVRFDFSTKSPCDLIKEKLRQPTSYNNTQYTSIMDMIMGKDYNISNE